MPKLTEKDYLVGWFLSFVLGTVVAFIVAFVAALVVTLPLSVIDEVPAGSLAAIGRAVGFLVSLPIYYLAFRLTIRHYFLPRFQTGGGAP